MSKPNKIEYRERLTPSFWSWLAIVGFALFTYIALVVVDPTIAAVTAPAVLVIGICMALFSAPVIAVCNGELRAGRAHIPVDVLGPVTTLDRAAVHKAMGVDFDPLTFACLRVGTGSAVWLPVLDAQDPAPAWLVSTRHPGALTTAINAARD